MTRPIDPTSERSLKPWEELGISRAAFYWRKRYGDLPLSIFKIEWPGELRNELRKLVRKHPDYDFWLMWQGWSSGGITRSQIEWLIKNMGLTRKANRIAASSVRPVIKPFTELPSLISRGFPEFADEGCAPPPYQPLEDLRAASLYEAFNDQEKAHFDTVAMNVLAQVTFEAHP